MKIEKVINLGCDRHIECITLSNDNGLEVEILTLGGIIKSIKTPDRYGVFENILLEYSDINTYLENPGYINAMIGRTAGRINKAEFTLNNNKYKLSQNENSHNLHGGLSGFDKKIWEITKLPTDKDKSVELSCKSNDNEEGYPGNLDIKIRYTLTNNNELHLEYWAVSDKDTLVNLTNHGYFNLSGNAKRNILDHELKISSSKICELGKESILTGNELNVSENVEFDFREFKNIGKDIDGDNKQLKIANGYDHPWIVDNKDDVAKLYDRKSGRLLSIASDQSVVVVYTMNGEHKAEFTNKKSNIKHYGITFESQEYPIGENECFKEKSILKAVDEYTQKTIWKFGVR